MMMPTRPHPPLLIVFGLVLPASAIALFFQITLSDFVLFHKAGVAWLAGTPIYTPGASNLNPPLAVVALFAPLARLELQAARAVWFALSLVAVVLSLWIVARESRWSRSHTLTMAAALMVTYPAWLAWYQGQLTWVLALPATLSWRAYRQGRLVEAGLWLAPVIALKPPFALVALFLPWRLCVAAGVGSASLTALSMAITGIGPWLDWWRFRDAVFWITWVDNLSLWGQLGRISLREVWQVRLSDLPAWTPAAVAAIGLAMAAWVRREADPDRRMALAWLSGTLLSPIGWVYYLPVGMAALLASATRATINPWLLFCVPFLVFYPIARGPLAWVVGSIYTVAAVWGWWAYAVPRSYQTHAMNAEAA
jgi:hypothetical protein